MKIYLKPHVVYHLGVYKLCSMLSALENTKEDGILSLPGDLRDCPKESFITVQWIVEALESLHKIIESSELKYLWSGLMLVILQQKLPKDYKNTDFWGPIWEIFHPPTPALLGYDK